MRGMITVATTKSTKLKNEPTSKASKILIGLPSLNFTSKTDDRDKFKKGDMVKIVIGTSKITIYAIVKSPIYIPADKKQYRLDVEEITETEFDAKKLVETFKI